MDEWNADLVIHVVQFLSVDDSNRFRLSAQRYFYLVQEFRRIRGPQMVSHTSQVRSLRSTTSTESTAKQLTRKAAQELQSPPNLALAFSTLSSTLAEDLSSHLPSDCVTLGVVSGSIQSTYPTLDCRSNAGLMLANLPHAHIQPFIFEFANQNQNNGPSLVVQQFQQQKTRDGTIPDWKLFLIYAHGEDAEVVEDVVSSLQTAFPQSTIVGGICNGGYCSESTQNITRQELESLTSVDLLQWYRGLGGRGGDHFSSWTKTQLVDHIFELAQTKPFRLRMLHDGGIFGVALAGDVPVKSVVSRGVQSLTNPHGGNEPSLNFVVHQAAIHRPGDVEYMFVVPNGGEQGPPPYHIVRTVQDTETGKIYTPQQLQNKFSRPDFVGLQRRDTDGFDLHMPHPISFNLDAFIFLLSPSAFQDEVCPTLEGTPIDLFDLTGEACLTDMDHTMTHLHEQTKGEELLAAIMVSCSARGPTGSSLLGESMADASRFANMFPKVPCLGFYAGGEIGPLALAGRKRDIFRQGQASLQGFTAVFALFIVPKFSFPNALSSILNDDPQNVHLFVRNHLNKAKK